MLTELADKVRVAAYRTLMSKRGNQWKAVKVLRGALEVANELVGRPACPEEELAERRSPGRRSPAAAPPNPAPARPGPPEAAPVLVYFDGKDHRTLERIRAVLDGGSLPYRILDVADDEASRSWALTASRQAELPLVFIGGEPVGGLHELTQLDLDGSLRQRVLG